MPQLTTASINGLRWIHSKEPVGYFDKSAPHHNIRRYLVARGLVARVRSKNPKLAYDLQLTESGRQVLEENGWIIKQGGEGLKS